MNFMEAEELAMLVVGMDEETSNGADLDEALHKHYGVTFEQFHAVAKALVQFTVPANEAFSGGRYKGFVYQGVFITKQPTEAP